MGPYECGCSDPQCSLHLSEIYTQQSHSGIPPLAHLTVCTPLPHKTFLTHSVYIHQDPPHPFVFACFLSGGKYFIATSLR